MNKMHRAIAGPFEGLPAAKYMAASALCLTLFLTLFSGAASAATFAPAKTSSSSLAVQLFEVGQVGSVSTSNNYASPVVSHGTLYLTDQRGGQIYRETSSGYEVVLERADAPVGIQPAGSTAFTGVSAGATSDKLFVMFQSKTLPAGLSAAELPEGYSGTCCGGTVIDDFYAAGGRDPYYQVIYQYDVGAGGLSNPVPISAFEVQSTGGSHIGGAMQTLPDGRLLVATGDNLVWGLNGLEPVQDDSEHVGKLLIIDPSDGSYTVAAKGIRNVQSMTLTQMGGKDYIVFGDIGGVTAEEVNTVLLSDLLDTSVVENFGWGIADDGKAREGTFYVTSGSAFADYEPEAIGDAPLGEAGFIQPYAQIGRTDPDDFFALSGPVMSDSSFNQIEMLFADLVSGGLYATLDPSLDAITTEVFDVTLFDDAMQEVSFLDLAAGSRADPRFFNFADGSAGVQIESTGMLYRLQEVSFPAVPLPAAGWLLLSGLSGLGLYRRKRRQTQGHTPELA